MKGEFKEKVIKWIKKNPQVAEEFINSHLPRILREPFKAGSKLKTKISLYSYHFHRRPEYRAIYSIESDKVIFYLIATREEVYRNLKNIF